MFSEEPKTQKSDKTQKQKNSAEGTALLNAEGERKWQKLM
jgi:hypothetical protein